MSKPLSRKEKQDLVDQIATAKARLATDRLTRPKRKLSEKQLENLRKGREANPYFHPRKPTDELSKKLDKQSKASNSSNGHVATGYK